MSIIETWQPIPTLESRYEASDQGRIRNIQSNNILKCDSRNSSCVSIVVNQTTHVFEVKLLVYAAFNPDIDIWKKPRPKIENINKDIKDNRLLNLKLHVITDEFDEIWKPIPMFETEYAVSNKGRVKRLPREDHYIRKDTNTECVRYAGEKLLRPTIPLDTTKST